MKVLVWIGLGGSLISVSSLFSSHHVAFDLLSHFRIQYIVLIALVLCAALWGKQYKVSALLIACLAVHAGVVANSLRDHEFDVEVQGPQLRIMSSNLLYGNADTASHIQFIKKLNPDVIVFQEYTFDWQAALVPALKDYVYRIEDPTIHAFGNALFSKYPLQNMSTPHLVDELQRSIDGTIVIEDTTLRVFATHPPPPMSTKMYRHRNTHLQRLADRTKPYSDPMLVMGDLNITPWSAHFQTFLNNGKLHDGRRGQGILPTWPTDIPLVQIPIDHILFNEGVRVLSMQTSAGLSSDHKAVWADITIAQ